MTMAKEQPSDKILLATLSCGQRKLYTLLLVDGSDNTYTSTLPPRFESLRHLESGVTEHPMLALDRGGPERLKHSMQTTQTIPCELAKTPYSHTLVPSARQHTHNSDTNYHLSSSYLVQRLLLTHNVLVTSTKPIG